MTTRELVSRVFPADDVPMFTARDRLHKALKPLMARGLVERVEGAKGHVYSLAPAERAKPQPARRPCLRGPKALDAVLALWFGTSG